MNTLHDNGKMVCQMAAYVAGGWQSNPANSGQYMNPSEITRICAEIVQNVLMQPEFRDDS